MAIAAVAPFALTCSISAGVRETVSAATAVSPFGPLLSVSVERRSSAACALATTAGSGGALGIGGRLVAATGRERSEGRGGEQGLGALYQRLALAPAPI